MLHKIKQTLLLAIVVFAPLIPKPELLLTWPVILAFLAGAFLNISQPKVSTEDLKTKDPRDRRSVTLIYLAATLSFLVPVLDYGYGTQVRPCWCEPLAKAGIIMIVAGLWFRYYAIRYLGKYFTGVVTVLEDHKVVDTGPYKLIRHPSYLGSFVMALGISAIFQSLAGLAICMFLFFPVYMFRIRVEELALREGLGEAYDTYCQKTWRMIPYVY